MSSIRSRSSPLGQGMVRPTFFFSRSYSTRAFGPISKRSTSFVAGAHGQGQDRLACSPQLS